MSKKEKCGQSEAQKPEKETPDEETVTEDTKGEEVKDEAAAGKNAEPEKPDDDKEKAKKELEKLNDKYLRVVAEYDNYRKRTVKEKESIYPEATASVTAQFLPVLDSLERALQSSDESSPLYDGLKMVMKQFEDALKSVRVEYIETAGQVFDPKLHNAVMHVEDDNYGENEIVEEFQKGYKIGDRIIRHSMVKVAN